MKIILKEGEEALEFLEELVQRVTHSVIQYVDLQSKEVKKNSDDERWVSSSKAKQILGIKSNKKLQSLRDNLEIKFSQHGRTIRYNKSSLYEFLEKNVVR